MAELSDIVKEITLLAIEKDSIKFDKANMSQEEVTIKYAEQIGEFFNTVYNTIKPTRKSNAAKPHKLDF